MLSIAVKNERQEKQFDHASGPIEFGRGPQRDVARFVIEDVFVSARDHLRVEELPDAGALLQNLSQKLRIPLQDGTIIPVNGNREVDLPVQILLGQTTIDIDYKEVQSAESVPPKAPSSQALPSQSVTCDPGAATPAREAGEGLSAEGYLTLKPVRRTDLPTIPVVSPLGESPAPETLARWMETVLALQRSDASPPEFYAQTARAMIRMIGLDVGLVLLYKEAAWQVVARAAQEDDDSQRGNRPSGREFSRTVLNKVLTEKQTFYQDLDQLQGQESLRSIDAVVVSPIFGLHEEVVGVLYGLRWFGAGLGNCKIRPLEAQLVQLLAAAVGAYFARTLATRTRTQFEQFFSAELVRELERDPALLEGRSQDVTILMSDLRSFSTLSERMGPQETCRLVRDLMERLSQQIVAQGGVIVSYQGDGLLAMWNAPARQEDHAARACRAALAMLREMPALNATWQGVVGHALELGIGLNTGPAQVGNTGSSRKFMYGPLGNTVNLASRVEGATKHLKVPILLTGSTRVLLGDAFVTRRLCQVRVAGIQGSVDLYELHGETASPEWQAFRDRYEAALALYESRQWLQTCQALLPLLEQNPNTSGFDHATLKLMKQSWAHLETPPDPFEPVLELSSK